MISFAPMSYFAMMPTGPSTRSKIEGSSFTGLFTLIEIGHIVMDKGRVNREDQGQGAIASGRSPWVR